VTISGINLGVSAFSPHPDDAFEAIKCLANKQNQATDAVKGGLPPTLAALYDDPAVQKAYPFHALIKHSSRRRRSGLRRRPTPRWSWW
jgi:multiple sugar transport system substrate-binding protein